MRIAAKLTLTLLFTASLLGFGAGAAAAGTDAWQYCANQQQSVGVINLNLNLLNSCIAQFNN